MKKQANSRSHQNDRESGAEPARETAEIHKDCGQILVDRYREPGAICKKCHDMDTILCRWCYCPRYHTDCGGNYTIMAAGIKDCSNCTIPHRPGFNPEVKTTRAKGGNMKYQEIGENEIPRTTGTKPRRLQLSDLAKPSCPKCHGRGYTGRDPQSGKKIACGCAVKRYARAREILAARQQQAQAPVPAPKENIFSRIRKKCISIVAYIKQSCYKLTLFDATSGETK